MSIIDEKRDDIISFCKSNGIEYLGVFGSYSRGDYRDDSDVDLLVRFNRVIGLLKLIRVEIDLAKLLGRKVDIVTEGGISELIKDSLNEEITPIYGQR